MPQHRTNNGTSIAADFLTRCFAPGETVALFLRRENPAGILQRIVPFERALAPRYLGWLAHENSIGANIYVAANPLHCGSRKRTKECIAAVRHLYLDLDTDGEARLASLRASDAVPPPNAIVSTSFGKYQVLWRVDGFTSEQQESALKLLAITFGGDPACTDCNRVLRLPGFLNCKYDPAWPVTVEYPGNSTWNSDDFRLDILAADAIFSSRSITPRKHSANHTNSEHDWAWGIGSSPLPARPTTWCACETWPSARWIAARCLMVLKDAPSASIKINLARNTYPAGRDRDWAMLLRSECCCGVSKISLPEAMTALMLIV